MTRRRLAFVSLAGMAGWCVGCIGWQVWHDGRLLRAIAAGGFVPWPAGANDAQRLFWMHAPGHGLHIVGLIGDRAGVAIVLVLLTGFLAGMAWMTRDRMPPPIWAVFSAGLSVLFTGAFFSVRFPTDFALDLDRRAYVDHGTRLAGVCDLPVLRVERSPASRGGSYYTVSGVTRAGGVVTLVVFNVPGAAYGLRDAVKAEVAGLDCPTG